MTKQEIRIMELKKIIPDKNQPRQYFEPKKLEKLKDSINKEGVINPIIVEDLGNDKYFLVDGERRFRASVQLNLKTIPCVIMPKMDELERITKRFHLQDQNSDWGLVEKAKVVMDLKNKIGLTGDEIKSILSLSPSEYNGYVALGYISAKTIVGLESKFINKTMAIELCRIVAYHKFSKEMGDKFQEAVVRNFENGNFKGTRDLLQLKNAMRFGNADRVLKSIIKSKNYSIHQALIDSNASGSLGLYNLIIAVGYTFTCMKKMDLKKNKSVVMTKLQYNKLKKAIDSYTELLSRSEIIEDEI